MASLIDIPNELLVGILSRLKAPDLAKICRVCHHLRMIAEPFLYRTVLVDIQFRSPRPTTHSFLLTILNRPVLANSVHELSLNWYYPTDYIQYLPGNPEVPGELATFKAAALNLGLADERPSHGAQIMLLLHFLPCLRFLDIHCRYPYSQLRYLLEEQAILPRPSLPPGLHSLRQFSCFCRNPYSGCSPLMVLGLFALPSIRILDICMLREMVICVDEDDEDDDDDCLKLDLSSPEYAGTSSVTDLRFAMGEVSSWSLMRIIPLARALTRFSFGERGSRLRSGFDIAQLRTALHGVRQTLQRLAVCFDYYRFSRSARDTTIETIGSLRDWPVLAEIRCPVSLLVGGGECQPGMVLRLVEVVPRVVRKVRIESDEYWWDEETAELVREMVELKDVYGLQRLAVVSIPEGWGEEEKIRSACDAASVGLVVVRKYPRA